MLTEGNTLLGDEELEMLVILRMIRDFMQFMHPAHEPRLHAVHAQALQPPHQGPLWPHRRRAGVKLTIFDPLFTSVYLCLRISPCLSPPALQLSVHLKLRGGLETAFQKINPAARTN